MLLLLLFTDAAREKRFAALNIPSKIKFAFMFTFACLPAISELLQQVSFK